MASDAYIQAAKLANRQPTTYMSVESAEGETLYYTTESQWLGSDKLITGNMTVLVDSSGASAINARFNFTPFTEIGQLSTPWKFLDGDGIVVSGAALVLAPVNDVYLNYLNTAISWPSTLGINLKIRVLVRDLIEFPTVEHITNEQTITGVVEGFGFTNISLVGTPGLVGGTTSYLIVQGFDTSLNKWFNLQQVVIIGSDTPLFYIKPTSQLVTSAIDFGSATSTNPIFSVDNLTESGSLIAYSYTYSTDDIAYTSGGPIVDGDSLVASRYFKIQADLTTTTGGRGKIREIQLKEGIFRYFGSHIDTPFNGVSPQIIPDSVSTLSQKIQINRGLSTTGETSVQMFWVPEVSDMIASGFLKGKDVAIYSGFVGLPTDAYEPILVGTWYDHTLDEVNRVITVKIRDAFKQFEKRKIPEEVINPATGEITTSPLTFTTTSLVTVMKQIFDEIGLRDRYISPDFNTLEAGDYSAEKYKVSRSLVKFGTVIGKPTDFNKLLDELAVTGSMYLVPQGNGQIKPKPFDPNQEHTATLDANEINFVNLKGNISEFFSRFYAYYNPKTTLTADPSDDTDDYDNGTAIIDVTAETSWFPERGTKQHFDKWKVGRISATTALTTPPQALIDLMSLWNSLFTEPLYTVSAKKIPPRFANIEPADVIEVDNLDLPVVDNAWLSDSTYTGEFKSFASETTTPVAIRLSPDESKAYVLSNGDTTIYQYTLSEPGVLSSATYDSKLYDLTSLALPVRDFAFNPDGTTFNVLTDGGNDVYQHNMTTAFDITTVFAVTSSNTITELTNAQALWFRNDGLKMYILNQDTSSKVFQYTLAAEFQPSSASYDSIFISVQPQDSAPVGLSFDIGGEFMYIVGSTTNKIYSYTLSSTWVVSSASFTGSADKTAQDATPQCMLVTNTGDKMHILGGTTDSVYTYELTSPFDITVKGYTEGDRVIHDGFMWRARQDSVGKDPTSEAAFWQNTQITDAGLTVGKHFFVLGRKFNPNQATMELDLMEMPPGTLGAFSADEFSSDFDIG